MALYASKIICYAQGYALMAAQAKASNWELNNGGIALMWRGGCIIRSAFLGKIKEAFDRNPKLANLLVDPYFAGEIGRAQAGWRRVIGGRRPPTASRCRRCRSALAYFDGYRTRPPAGEPAPGPARLLRRPHLRARSTSRAASSSTPTGPAAAAPPRARRTTRDQTCAPSNKALTGSSSGNRRT